MLRWGNYDYATGQTRWSAAEVPADNGVPGTQTLPASLFLSSRPGWWGAMPWPAIGPDVTGGHDPAGRVHKIPARVCYESSARRPDGTLAFDAAQCYPGTPPDTTLPNVSVTSPSNGATISGPITVGATASDNVGVAGVQFKLDGSDVGPEVTATPYAVSWNTTGATNGSHSLCRRRPRRSRQFQDVHGHRRHREQRDGHDRAVCSR